MKPSSLAAPYVVAASTFAAAALVSAASADITFTLTNQTFTGFDFIRAYAAGSLTGILTGATVNATLYASTNYTYADDLCVYVGPTPFNYGGLLQCGGYSNLNATQRYRWASGGSNTPGTPVTGTVNFTTAINMAANPTQSIWIGNGYSASGTSGTWTGTITLLGVSFNTADCNNNGVPDSCDITNGAIDKDANGQPDDCQYAYGDFDLSGDIGGGDLGFLLAVWGTKSVIGDLDGDHGIGGGDLAVLLSRWGPVQ
jgi:hypothetical protein